MKPENLTLFNQIENGMLIKGNTFVIFDTNLLKAGDVKLWTTKPGQPAQEGF